MKKIILMVIFIPVATLFFSGCGSSKKESQMKNQTAEEKNQEEQSTGYIDGMLGIKKQAEENINNAIQKEDNKINQAMGEENMDYIKKYNLAEIETNFGKIRLKLDSINAPIAVNNFLKLSDQKFYDGTKFHRVIKGFMIQGGDPNSKSGNPSTWGTGGPGYKFNDEFNSRKLIRGSLAMANSGPDTNGSQFFIVTAASTPWLDGKHTNFGEVISGMEIVDKIENLPTGTNDRPVEDVVIKGITLLSEK